MDEKGSRNHNLTDAVTKAVKKVLEELLKTDKIYHHCGYCGKIFYDEERKRVVLDLMKLFNSKAVPGIIFQDFENITSSFCVECKPKYQKKIAEEIELFKS